MKLGQEGYFDLTYCSNIHSGETWGRVFANMKEYLPQLKTDLAPDAPFGVGLRLSNRAADGLLENGALQQAKEWLSENQFYVMTINAFPYGNFHRKGIKDRVYAPDWTTKKRRDYSLKIARILAALTPEGGESGFSTVPLSYKPWLNPDTTVKTYHQSAIFLSDVVQFMAETYEKTGTLIHIDIEAEPDCLIETNEELIAFFNTWLLPVGVPYLAQKSEISQQKAEEQLRRHVQVCYDVCHSCVEFEKPVEVFNDLAKAEIQIGKIQISAALKYKLNKDADRALQAEKTLSEFIDPVYLHQVVKHHADNTLSQNRDLNDSVLSQLKANNASVDEIRTHFHVPIFLEHYEHLDSTQSNIIDVIKLLQNNRMARHLEIETYTWDVLPPSLKLDMMSSIKREYEWVIRHF